MKWITETLTGNLAFAVPDRRLEYLVSLINSVVKPPRPATPDNVNIRAMYVVNDRVNSHGGQFRREDLLTLCMLIADTPVLVGHNRSGAPLARTFHAEIEVKDDVAWLKSFFYWPKTESPDIFGERIDSGVFKECSISFAFTWPECSLCGEDIRRCPHEPGPGVHFIYRCITNVFETSLVFKGSVEGTHITDRLDRLSNRIVLRSRHDQAEMILPSQIDSHYATIHPIDIELKHYHVVSSPTGFRAATAIMHGKPYLVIKREDN